MSEGYLRQLTMIRSLNDDLRTRLRGGSLIVADDIKELGATVVAHALLTMADSTDFLDEEHSAGSFQFCARSFFWQISYGGSDRPADARATRRVLYLSL